MTSEKQKMMAGDLYDPGDADLVADRKRAQRLMSAYNATIYGDAERPALFTPGRHRVTVHGGCGR